MEFIKITKEEAKEMYCKCKNVYVTTNERTHWKMPAASAYGSHAPIAELFYRSIPEYEGEVEFFKAAK